jgi:lysozyme
MRLSDAGLSLIKKFEGLKLSTYRCSAGKLTIGYGHTGADVNDGMKISLERADELLQSDVARFERSVNELVTVAMTQGMFDALVSFCYNLGAANLKGSTLLKKLNANDKARAAEEFGKWVNANGKPLVGLAVRRAAERELFLS